MRPPALLAVLVAVAAACEDPTETARTDSLGFSFDGDLAGSFMAVGLPPAAQGRLPGSEFAVAVTQQTGRLGLVARISTGPLRGHVIRIANVPAVVGSFPIGGQLTGRFEINSGEGTSDGTYAFTDGTVTITAIAGARVRGAFYGTAAQADSQGRSLGRGRPLVVAGGLFNLTIDAPAAAGYGCLVFRC